MIVKSRTWSAGSSRALARWLFLLGSTAVVLAPASQAGAQENQLRGRVGEAQVTGELLGTRAAERSAQQPYEYEPVSPGALEDEDTGRTDSLFPMPDADGTFSPRPAPRPAARAANTPETARPAAAPASAEQPDEEETTGADGTGQARQVPIERFDEQINPRVGADSAPASPIETGDIGEAPPPYSPLGLRVGTFDVYTTLDQGLTWSTNPDFAPGGGEGLFSETQLRLNAVSDWSRHSARFNTYGIFRESISGADVSDAQGGFDAAFTADLARELTADAALSYSIRPESASSPVVIVGATSEPLLQEMTGSLGLSKGIGKARFGLTGTLQREIYSDADIAGGGTLSQEERNFTLATVALRAGYEISPAVIPFVEGEIGRRFYDLDLDSAGYARSADRLALRGGVELDFGEKLSGEVSAGLLREDFDDDRLTPVSALLLEGALAWSPSRETTVTLLGTTEVEGTTNAAESGSVRYAASLELQRQVRANLTLGALAGVAWRDYVNSPDHERTLSAEANATWWLNRFAGINTRLRHERFESTLAGRDYDASSIYLGLKLQR